MADSLIPVNLGFAEFIAQLARETFDAVLDSRAEQVRKQEVLLLSLKLSIDEFSAIHVDDGEVRTEATKLLGADIYDSAYHLPTNISDRLALLHLTPQPSYLRSKTFTIESLRRVKTAIRNMIGAQKRSLLEKTIMGYSFPTIVIDSGEIKARVNFSVSKIAASTPSRAAIPQATGPVSPKAGVVEQAPPKVNTVTQTRITNFSSLKNLGVEYYDPKTKEKFVLIDRKAVAFHDSLNPLPDVRLTVRQVDPASALNMSSEVTIRFKAI